MSENQEIIVSVEKLALNDDDSPAPFSSAPYPQYTPAVERYRAYKQKVEGPNRIKEEYPRICSKVLHYTQLVEKVTLELTTLSPSSAVFKKIQKKLALAQKNLEDFLKWKEVLKENAEILMIITNLPFMLVEGDNIYARCSLMYFYTTYPFMNMTRLPREEDQVYVQALRAEAKKLGGIPEMELMEEMPKKPKKVVQSRKRHSGEPVEGSGKPKRATRRG